MARATTKKTTAERIITNKKDIKTTFAMGRRIRSGVSSAGSIGSGQGSGGTVGIEGFLPTSGGTMMGPIAFFPQPVSVLSDSIDISIDNGNFSSFVVALGQGGAADNLSKIIGAYFSGQELIIQAATTTPITLKDIATPGNIHLPGGLDVLIPALDAVTMVFDSTQPSGGRWILSAGSGSGGGFTNPATADLDMNGFNIIVDADGNSKFNLVTDDIVILELGGVTKYVWTTLGMSITNSYIEAYEIATPTTPSADRIRIYAKDWGGITKLTSLDSTGTETTVGSDNLGNHQATQNLNMGNFDITAVKGIDLDDLNSKIQGIKTLEFVSSFPNIHINSDGSTGLVFVTDVKQGFQFFAGLAKIATFEEIDGGVGGGVYQLDMNGNKIIKSRELKFSTTDNAVINNTEAAIGYVDSLNIMKFNIPTGNSYLFKTNDDDFVSIAGSNLSADVVNTDVVQFGVSAVTPSFPGEMRSNGTDVRVWSGGGLRNLSDIQPGGGSSFADNVFNIFDNLDNNKKITFNLDNMGPGVQSILAFSDSGTRTYTFPNITTVLTGNAAVNNFTQANTFNGTVTINGFTNINGSIQFGDTTGDTIAPVGRFIADLLPIASGIRDLGSAALQWDDIYGEQIFASLRMKIPVGTNLYS